MGTIGRAVTASTQRACPEPSRRACPEREGLHSQYPMRLRCAHGHESLSHCTPSPSSSPPVRERSFVFGPLAPRRAAASAAPPPPPPPRRPRGGGGVFVSPPPPRGGGKGGGGGGTLSGQ